MVFVNVLLKQILLLWKIKFSEMVDVCSGQISPADFLNGRVFGVASFFETVHCLIGRLLMGRVFIWQILDWQII